MAIGKQDVLTESDIEELNDIELASLYKMVSEEMHDRMIPDTHTYMKYGD